MQQFDALPAAPAQIRGRVAELAFRTEARSWAAQFLERPRDQPPARRSGAAAERDRSWGRAGVAHGIPRAKVCILPREAPMPKRGGGGGLIHDTIETRALGALLCRGCDARDSLRPKTRALVERSRPRKEPLPGQNPVSRRMATPRSAARETFWPPLTSPKAAVQHYASERRMEIHVFETGSQRKKKKNSKPAWAVLRFKTPPQGEMASFMSVVAEVRPWRKAWAPE